MWRDGFGVWVWVLGFGFGGMRLGDRGFGLGERGQGFGFGTQCFGFRHCLSVARGRSKIYRKGFEFEDEILERIRGLFYTMGPPQAAEVGQPTPQTLIHADTSRS